MTHTPGPWRTFTCVFCGENNADVIVDVGPTNACSSDLSCRERVAKQRDRARDHRRRLFEALAMLSNEVGGLGAFEIEIRFATGNTNWAVLTQRYQEAVSLLDELRRDVAPGGAA